MRDIFSEGLLYLDLLEIYGSSYSVAELCGVAQSNVFRGANACSKLLNLGLKKDRAAGRYEIVRNQDVQRDLRRLNQRLRARENGQLRVVGPVRAMPDQLPIKQSSLLRALPDRWADQRMSLSYLERGLLDLVIMPSWQLPEDIPWPQRARRADLFLPAQPCVFTELAPWPLILLARSGEVSLSAQAALLTDQKFPLSILDHLPISAEQLLFIESQEQLLEALCDHPSACLLTTPPEAQHLLALEDRPSLERVSWEEGPRHPALLLFTLPNLVNEPLHQELTSLLRQHAVQLATQAELALKCVCSRPAA